MIRHGIPILLVLALASCAHSGAQPHTAQAGAGTTSLHANSAHTAPGSAAQPYIRLSEFKVGGEGGWSRIAVDRSTGSPRLFVTRETRVDVLDADTGVKLGEIAGTPNVHRVIVVPALNRGFTSNGGDNTCTAFDLLTLKPLGKVRTGINPDALVYEPATRNVFVCNSFDKSVTAFDPASLEVLGTTDVGGMPADIATDGQGSVFVAGSETNDIIRIDARSRTVVSRSPTLVGIEPLAIAVDPVRRLVYAALVDANMEVQNLDTGAAAGAFPIGNRIDDLHIDPFGRVLAPDAHAEIQVYASDGRGGFQLEQSVPTSLWARSLAQDPVTSRLYVPVADYIQTEKAPVLKPGSFRIIVIGPSGG